LLLGLCFSNWQRIFLFVLLGGRLTQKLLCILVAGFACALTACVLNGWLGFDPEAAIGVLNSGHNWQSFGAGALRVGFSFFAGVLIHRLHERANSFRISAAITVLLFVVTAATLLAGQSSGSHGVALELVTVLIIFPLVIVMCSFADTGKACLTKPMEALGLLSYGIYVLQVPVFRLVELGAARLALRAAWVALILETITSSMLTISHRHQMWRRSLPATDRHELISASANS
jgi:peptidoglycan/LPS O-acetylase OafA/YrhL